MSGLVRYLAGYLLDSFRERVTREDFAGETVRRAVACGEGMEAVARGLFPAAEVVEAAQFPSTRAMRRARFDAAVIAMRGEATGPRLRAALSGARHILLVPSPDYVYRLGMRRGAAALVWALVDRLLLAPLALMWLGVLRLAMVATGLTRRARLAQELVMRNPLRVLVIRLVPTPVLVQMLERLRRTWPSARVAVVIAAPEGASELDAVAEEVICTAGGGVGGAVRAVRAFRPDVAILTGGADRGQRSAYLKARLLLALSGARARWHWEHGQPPPGRPMRERALEILLGVGSRPEPPPRARPLRGLARRRRRRAYHRLPRRGPQTVQIGISEACNYQCRMCPFHNPAVDVQHNEADLPRMSLETFARLAYDLKRLGTEVLDICGNGEALTHPRAMDMLALACELGFKVTLATNAALLTEQQARQLVDMGLARLRVSINAGSEESYAQIHPGVRPGTMGRIIARLRAMDEYGRGLGRPVRIELSAVLHRLSAHELPALVELARAAQAKRLWVIRMGPAAGAEDLLPRPEDWEAIRAGLARAKELADRYGIVHDLADLEPVATAAGTRSIYEEVPCYIGHGFSLIFASGLVDFCCHCQAFPGRVTEQRFAEIWRSEAYQELRRQAMALPRTRKPPPGCGCFHSCSHVAYNVTVHEVLYGAPRRRK